jgi:hypothetical protein
MDELQEQILNITIIFCACMAPTCISQNEKTFIKAEYFYILSPSTYFVMCRLAWKLGCMGKAQMQIIYY